MSSSPRPVAAPFVAAAPAGARVRTRLRVSGQDEAVLRAAGSHLGSLAGRDLAARCAEGRLDAKGRAVSRREWKRQLTAVSSSRWAGSITRTTEDQVLLAERNLAAERSSLKARIRRIEVRLAVPAGGRNGRVRGYATQAERHGRQQRLQHLRQRFAQVEQRLDAGLVSVCRGGRRLARTRHNLEAAGLTQEQWQERWEAGRLFLTADGEKRQAPGQRNHQVAPRRAVAGDQAPGPSGAPGEPAPRPVPAVLPRRVQPPGRRGRGAGHVGSHPVRRHVRPGEEPLVPGCELAHAAGPRPVPGGPEASARPRRGLEPRSSRRVDRHSRRQPARPAGHGTARPGRAARGTAGRQAPRRGQRTDPPRPRARLPRDRGRGSRLCRGACRGPRAEQEPAVARPAREGVPADRGGHPHRQVP